VTAGPGRRAQRRQPRRRRQRNACRGGQWPGPRFCVYGDSVPERGGTVRAFDPGLRATAAPGRPDGAARPAAGVEGPGLAWREIVSSPTLAAQSPCAAAHRWVAGWHRRLAPGLVGAASFTTAVLTLLSLTDRPETQPQGPWPNGVTAPEAAVLDMTAQTAVPSTMSPRPVGTQPRRFPPAANSTPTQSPAPAQSSAAVAARPTQAAGALNTGRPVTGASSAAAMPAPSLSRPITAKSTTTASTASTLPAPTSSPTSTPPAPH
jgi:hypothetical protein